MNSVGRLLFTKGLAVLAALFLLSGCGGGDDDSTTTAPTPTPVPVRYVGTTLIVYDKDYPLEPGKEIHPSDQVLVKPHSGSEMDFNKMLTELKLEILRTNFAGYYIVKVPRGFAVQWARALKDQKSVADAEVDTIMMPT